MHSNYKYMPEDSRKGENQYFWPGVNFKIKLVDSFKRTHNPDQQLITSNKSSRRHFFLIDRLHKIHAKYHLAQTTQKLHLLKLPPCVNCNLRRCDPIVPPYINARKMIGVVWSRGHDLVCPRCQYRSLYTGDGERGWKGECLNGDASFFYLYIIIAKPQLIPIRIALSMNWWIVLRQSVGFVSALVFKTVFLLSVKCERWRGTFSELLDHVLLHLKQFSCRG